MPSQINNPIEARFLYVQVKYCIALSIIANTLVDRNLILSSHEFCHDIKIRCFATKIKCNHLFLDYEYFIRLIGTALIPHIKEILAEYPSYCYIDIVN
jgi:hypothetical protein